MAYISRNELERIGFKNLGKSVLVSDKASIYNPELIELGDFCRIDDFCVISGNISFGSYCHVTPMCLLAGGEPGIEISDFCTFAYGVKVFAQSDDYSGNSMVNSLIPKKYKDEKFEQVKIGRQSVIGAGATILPGVTVAEGTAVGAMSLVIKSTHPWGIYAGIPASRMKERSQKVLEIEKEFWLEKTIDSI
jgi:acetyltransferase-like isoleucine patch superfamily enzyme